jgi:hypothetical protein
MKGRITILLFAWMLSGCALLRGRSSAASDHSARATGFDRKDAAKSSVPGVTPDMASKYGCAWTQVQANWSNRRMTPAAAGQPLCDVLGRYGQPFSVSTRRASDMQLLSLQYRPNGRNVNLIAVHYDDTPVNRKLRRRVGVWTVQSYSNPR